MVYSFVLSHHVQGLGSSSMILLILAFATLPSASPKDVDSLTQLTMEDQAIRYIPEATNLKTNVGGANEVTAEISKDTDPEANAMAKDYFRRRRRLHAGHERLSNEIQAKTAEYESEENYFSPPGFELSEYDDFPTLSVDPFRAGSPPIYFLGINQV
jgi:hypothetical protein